jgi:hypothetical protein
VKVRKPGASTKDLDREMVADEFRPMGPAESARWERARRTLPPKGGPNPLTKRERLRLLRIFDEVVPLVPPRPVSQVKREIEKIRRARHAGGRGGARGAAR